MRYKYATILSAIAFGFIGGCSDRPSQKQQETNSATAKEHPADVPKAPDIRDGWQWSKAELAETTTRADSGDLDAANRLFQYYSVHEDQEKIAYWQDWLFKRGDPGAIELRVHKLFTSAGERKPSDIRKLRELQEAERLWVSVNRTGEDDSFLDKIRSEIASVETARAD